MDLKQYLAAAEAVLFACGEPVSADKLAEALEIGADDMERVLLLLQDEYAKEEHGFELLRLEDRWQFATKNEYAAPVKHLLEIRRNAPLSQAAMETLTIIAYNQPISRSFIEQVRGVDSSSIVAGLVEKGLVEEAGRLDLPGHPVSFRTTDVFLRAFGLSSIEELPPLHPDSPLEEAALDAELENAGIPAGEET